MSTRGGSNDVTLPLIATDAVAGVAYQVVKLDVGALGATVPVVGALPVSAASLPLPTGAATAALQPYVPNVFKPIAAVAVTAGTPVAVWTPATGKSFRLMGYALSLSVAGSVILKDATTEAIRTPLMAAGVGQSSPAMGNGILSAAANNVLNADVTATGSVSGFVFGTEQ